jgi:hypothetical protein
MAYTATEPVTLDAMVIRGGRFKWAACVLMSPGGEVAVTPKHRYWTRGGAVMACNRLLSRLLADYADGLDEWDPVRVVIHYDD